MAGDKKSNVIDFQAYSDRKEREVMSDEAFEQFISAFPLREFYSMDEVGEAKKARKAVADFIDRSRSSIPVGIVDAAEDYLEQLDELIAAFEDAPEDL